MALAVVCVLSLSLLTGCQQTQTTEETGSTTGDGTTTAATTAPTKPEPLGDYTQRTLALTEVTEGLRYDGRVTPLDDRVGIDWTYSGFTFRADCQGDIQVTMKAVNISNPSYMVAVLDGETLSAQDILDRRVKVTTKKAYTVLTDVPAGVHDIQLVKLTEAQLGLLDVYDLTINGQLMELPEDDRLKIEFIGDSITSGLGNLWNSSMDRQTNGLADQDGYHTYAAFTARALNADAHVVSLSGWGVAGGWLTPPEDAAIENAYGYRSYYRNHTSEQWDFSSWQPDIVVINLGTNDKGIPTPVDDETLKAKVLELFADIRDHYPQAQIVWAYGLMGTAGGSVEQVVRECMEERAAQGDAVPYTYVTLPMDQNGGGAHPNVSGQERAGRVLTAALKKLI